MNDKNTIQNTPKRNEIKNQDTWNLEDLFQNPNLWEEQLQKTITSFKKFANYENTLKEDKNYILQILQEYYALIEQAEHLQAYAFLAYSSDMGDTKNQELFGKVNNAGLIFSQSCAFFNEELLSLNENFLHSLCDDTRFAEYKQTIKKIIRKKNHTLSKAEEKLLANQVEYADGFQKSFSALINADLKFGTIQTPEGEIELSHATFSVLLEHKDRNVRQQAYTQYLDVFKSHVNVLTSLYASSIQQDNAHAKIRKHQSALNAALYANDIPNIVYDLLIKTTNNELSALHKYYEVLKKITKINDFAPYDTSYCPFEQIQKNIPYEEAVDILHKALLPLGEQYVNTLREGLLQLRWVDRYENVGKRSGAFSYPIYKGNQYIMMNYQSKSINHMFTLAHEGGHSMHSYLSAQENAFPNFHYSIFAAEIASTLNEHLLYKYLIKNATNTQEQLFYLYQKTKAFVGTFFRQTMFAEFEHLMHQTSDKGIPLTSQLFVSEYQNLNKKYQGPTIKPLEQTGIVGLRIPHFYSSYYVYQYATGIAAATSLGEQIYEEFTENKTTVAREKYFDFLKSGGSLFPIDALKLANIDFTQADVIQNAINSFKNDVTLLEKLYSEQ